MRPLTADQARTVEAYQPHVRALAHRLARRWPAHIERGDVEQFGMLGLMDAVQRYDPTAGAALWTFAQPRVHGAIMDGLRRDSWPRAVRRARRWLSDPALAGDVSVDLQRRVAAAEAIAGAAPTHLLPEWVYGAPTEDPHDALFRREISQNVSRAIGRLRPRDRHIVLEYYGAGRAMHAIARDLGVNESRVSQLLARARRDLAPILISLGVHSHAAR